MPSTANNVRARRLAALAKDLGVENPEVSQPGVTHKLICDNLVTRLTIAGYMGPNPKSFRDPRRNADVIIDGRQSPTATSLNVIIDGVKEGYSVMYAAECALPDIADLLEGWESREV
jgi:hypothetical protein